MLVDRDRLTHRQTDSQTDKLIAILRSPTGAEQKQKLLSTGNQKKVKKICEKQCLSHTTAFLCITDLSTIIENI